MAADKQVRFKNAKTGKEMTGRELNGALIRYAQRQFPDAQSIILDTPADGKGEYEFSIVSLEGHPFIFVVEVI